MADVVNPLPYLADLVEFFTEGAVEGGLHIDAELCRDFAAGMAEAGEIVGALLTLAEAQGAIERPVLSAAPPRGPAERRRLAALAIAVDPEARVVRFPVSPAQSSIAEGGTAA